MFGSIQAGVAALHNEMLVAALHNEVGAALVWPVDQPLISVETVRAIAAAEPADLICAPRHQGRGGHPVRIPRRLFAELLALPIEGGLHALMRSHAAETLRLPVEDAAVVTDIDTPDDYARVL